MIKSMYTKLLNQTRKDTNKLEIIPKPNYIYIVSFPKSGNTWIRFLLANAQFNQANSITFQEIGKYIPDMHRPKDIEFINDINSPFNRSTCQFIKTHSSYSTKYHNVIYIVRDGRDALTSYYHWINARVGEHIQLSDIIKGNTPFGLWSDHVLGWVNGNCRKKLVIKYEDLLVDTEKHLERILSFAGLEIGRKLILRSIELSSFENMQKLEKQYGLFDGHQKYSEKELFIRRGDVGDWKNLFTESDIELFWKYHGNAMKTMNYRNEHFNQTNRSMEKL